MNKKILLPEKQDFSPKIVGGYSGYAEGLKIRSNLIVNPDSAIQDQYQ